MPRRISSGRRSRDRNCTACPPATRMPYAAAPSRYALVGVTARWLLPRRVVVGRNADRTPCSSLRRDACNMLGRMFFGPCTGHAPRSGSVEMCSADERNRCAGIDIRNNGYETSHEGWSGYQEVVFPLGVRFALTAARIGYLVAVLVVLDRWVPLDAVVRAQLLLLRAVLRSIAVGIRRNRNQAFKDSHGIGANVVPRTFRRSLLRIARCVLSVACWPMHCCTLAI